KLCAFDRRLFRRARAGAGPGLARQRQPSAEPRFAGRVARGVALARTGRSQREPSAVFYSETGNDGRGGHCRRNGQCGGKPFAPPSLRAPEKFLVRRSRKRALAVGVASAGPTAVPWSAPNANAKASA